MTRLHLLAGVSLWLLAAATAPAADVILNEYNSVGSSRYLDDDNYADLSGVRVDKQDAYFATLPALAGDGRVQGNGGNWFELVVTGDHVDMRGWQLRWAEMDKFENDGTTIWAPAVGGFAPNQGIITLADDPAWSDLRAGTIITFSELAGFQVDTTPQGSNINFNDFADPLSSDGSYEAQVDLSTDVSFTPQADDWWIHVSTRDEAGKASPLVTTVYNTVDASFSLDPAGSFSTGNDDWELTIVDAQTNVVFGPSGEVQIGQGLNSREVFKLEGTPSAALTGTEADGLYNDGTSSTFGQPNEWDGGMQQDFSALRSWAAAADNADFNGDGTVDGGDLLIWQRNYPTASGAGVADGDANSDHAVDANDLTAWQSQFGPVGAPLGAAVPEPQAVVLALLAIASLRTGRPRRFRCGR
ncbi:MAG: hypothetical protein KDA44_22215 [Planctomycetales bacterium]|nr:hypothetical protein [Planctomycetales bacterium]